MTDQVKRALELVDFWRNLYCNNDGIFNAINHPSPSTIVGMSKVIDFFISVIREVEINLADANTINSLIGGYMNDFLEHSGLEKDSDPYVEIKAFLNKLGRI